MATVGDAALDSIKLWRGKLAFTECLMRAGDMMLLLGSARSRALHENEKISSGAFQRYQIICCTLLHSSMALHEYSWCLSAGHFLAIYSSKAEYSCSK
jgi:hypothetical protein